MNNKNKEYMYTLEKIQDHQIDKNTVNEQLIKLYSSKWDFYIAHIRDNTKYAKDATNPYLICASEKYIDAKLKIMLFGKETNGWGGEFKGKNPTIEDLMKLYDLFVNDDWGGSSPFWQFYSSIADIQKNKVAIIANNIVKIGKQKESGFDKDVYEEMKSNFNVVQKEIEILKPDIIIAVTGTEGDYDKIISDVLGTYQEQVCDESMSLSKFLFNEKNYSMYRCYHPRYLHYQGFEKKAIDYFEKVIEDALSAKK